MQEYIDNTSRSPPSCFSCQSQRHIPAVVSIPNENPPTHILLPSTSAPSKPRPDKALDSRILLPSRPQTRQHRLVMPLPPRNHHRHPPMDRLQPPPHLPHHIRQNLISAPGNKTFRHHPVQPPPPPFLRAQRLVIRVPLPPAEERRAPQIA